MNRKNKSTLIAGLLAAIVLMAVGYAAFSTTLTIGSSASVSSTWNVAFDTTKTSGRRNSDTSHVNFKNFQKTPHSTSPTL